MPDLRLTKSRWKKRETQELYKRIQEAVDAVNAEGVDYTFLIAHLGIEETTKPFTSVDVIYNTTGIDVVLDGHSHSTVPMELVKNKDREDVILTQTGTQFKSIGKLTLDQSGRISTELITDVPEKDEKILADIEKERAAFQDKIEAKIAHSDFELMVNEGDIQLARNNETNLGKKWYYEEFFRRIGYTDEEKKLGNNKLID